MKMKRLLAVLISVSLVIGCFPLTTLADIETEEDQTLVTVEETADDAGEQVAEEEEEYIEEVEESVEPETFDIVTDVVLEEETEESADEITEVQVEESISFDPVMASDVDVSTWDELKQALLSASPEGTTITLVWTEQNQGVIRSSGGEGDCLYVNSDALVTIDLNGCTLDRNRLQDDENSCMHGSVIQILAGGILYIKNSADSAGTITGGNAFAGGAFNNQGDLMIIAGSVIITGNRVSSTEGSHGGAIFNNGNLFMSTGTITGNNGADGGAIYNTAGSSFDLHNVVLSDNGTNPHGGGAVTNYGTATLTDCTISRNIAQGSGGGIYNGNNASMTLTNCSVTGNKTAGNGGGICNYGDLSTEGTDFEENTSIEYTENHIKGAGVYNSGTFTMTGGSFFYNQTLGEGGGLHNCAGCTATLSGVSITNNYSAGITNFGTVNLADCTITGNDSFITTNSSPGMYNNGILNIRGCIKIYNNNSLLHKREDLYLEGTSVITVTGEISPDSVINVGGSDMERFITSGWAANSGITSESDVNSIIRYLNGKQAAVYRCGEIGMNITYLNRYWDSTTNTIAEEIILPDEVPHSINSSEDLVTLSSGWYYAEGQDIVNRIATSSTGTINIILCDGCELYVNGGITHILGSVLNIYGQSVSSGKLYAGTYISDDYAGISDDYAGIGGTANDGCGEINIMGGNVIAQGGANQPGIGGIGSSSGVMGNITVLGGGVHATGGQNGAGIGTGYRTGINWESGSITVRGGVVEAIAGEGGAGIGSGYAVNMGSRTDITISGGIVTSTGKGGADLGAGRERESTPGGGECEGTIVLSGGRVTLNPTSGNYIGHGYEGDLNGSLTLDNWRRVQLGYELITTGNRVGICQSSGSQILVIDTCPNTFEASDYHEYDAHNHSASCRYCGFTSYQPHNFIGGVCSICNYVYQGDPGFIGHAMQLSGVISLEFYVDAGEIDIDDCYVTFESRHIPVGTRCDPEEDNKSGNEGNTFKVHVDISSIMMAEPITPTLHYIADGEEHTIGGAPYSAQDYIIYALNNLNHTDPAYGVIVALGDYGYYSQLYLSAQNGWVIGEDYDAFSEDAHISPDYAYDTVRAATSSYAVDSNIDTAIVASAGYRVRFGAEVSLIVTLRPAGEALDPDLVTVDGFPGARVEEGANGSVVVYIEGIPATDLGSAYTISYEGTTITLSPMSFVYDMLNRESSTTEGKNIVCALYYFAQACGSN